jgi:hypothetical protein
VSKSVRKELLERFTPMNKSILDKIFEQVVNGEELVNALAEDKEFKSILTDLAKKVWARLARSTTSIRYNSRLY